MRILKNERYRAVTAVAFSPDGKTLANGSGDNTIKLWDVATGTELRVFKGHTSAVASVAFSPGGKILASGSADNTVKLWDVATGAELRTLKGPSSMGPGELVEFRRNGMSIPFSFSYRCVAFSPDGKTLASGGGLQRIDLWDVATGTESRTLKGHFGSVESVAFSPDGKTLASGSDDGTVKLWNLENGSSKTLGDDSGWTSITVYTVAFSPDGKLLASGDSANTIKFWDLENGRELKALRENPDGSNLSDVRAVAFSPDGKSLASGTDDNTVNLWDVSTGRALRTLEGHYQGVRSIDFSPDGRTLASGSGDLTIKLWEVASGKELASLVAVDERDWIVVTPDGLFEGSPRAWNRIIWRFDSNTFNYAPAEAFFSDFFYPGLLADIFAGKRPKAPSDISQKDRRQPKLKLALAGIGPDATVAARNVTAKIDISQAPAGARDLRLFRNGSLVKVWPGDVLKGLHRITLETTIPIVAGENRFTAYVFNHDNVKSRDASLTVNGADSLKRKGVAYVLAVGINQYANPDYNLSFSVPDAQDFAEEMRRQQIGLENFGKIEVVPL